jgi:hypothetical protein
MSLRKFYSGAKNNFSQNAGIEMSTLGTTVHTSLLPDNDYINTLDYFEYTLSINNSILGNDSSFFDEDKSDKLLQTWRKIQATLFMLLIICGTIGNIMCVVVYSKKEMRLIPANCIFIALALADTVMLVWIVGDNLVELVTENGLGLKSHAVWLCATYHVTFGVIVDFTSLLVICVSVYHCVGIVQQRHRRSNSRISNTSSVSRQRVNVTIGISMASCVIINLHFAWCVRLDDDEGGYEVAQCYVTCNEALNVMNSIKLITSIAVVAVIVSFLFYFKCCRNSSWNAVTSGVRRMSDGTRSMPLNHNESNLTQTLLTLCVTFLVINCCLLAPIFTTFPSDSVAYDLIMLLWLSQFASRFIIYFITGCDFRHGLRLIFLQLSRHRAPDQNSSVSYEAFSMLDNADYLDT